MTTNTEARARALFNKARLRSQKSGHCLAAEFDSSSCSGKAISAHSVARSDLKLIAENGHLLTGGRSGKPPPLKVGIGHASTFRGFCSHHDSQIFGPIDNATFTGSEEQFFLVSLRALAHESTSKLSHNSAMSTLSDEQSGFDTEDLRSAASNFSDGLQAGQSNLRIQREEAWARLRRNNFNGSGGLAWTFSPCPPLVACGHFSYGFDFQGRQLQDVAAFPLSLRIEGTACFILPLPGNRGVAGVAWTTPTQLVQRFFRSLRRIPDSDGPSSILRLALSYLDNCFWKPSWWEGLSAPEQNWMTRRWRHGLTLHPYSGTELLDDGTRLLPVHTVKRLEVPPACFSEN